MNTSADDYLAAVGGLLADVPTPSINAAVMRGAGVRLSSPREGIPGPRRLILDGTTTGRHLATGATATALLASQRRNLAYLDAQRALLAEDETRADDEMRSPVEEREDHAAEVLGILRALPLLSGDFPGVFDEVADLAGIEQHGGVWEVRAVGGEAAPALESLGDGFTLDALKTQTAANAARLRRWRTALRGYDESVGGGPATAPSRSARAAKRMPVTAKLTSPPAPSADEQDKRMTQNAASKNRQAGEEGLELT